jgi:hypothetical protein
MVLYTLLNKKGSYEVKYLSIICISIFFIRSSSPEYQDLNGDGVYTEPFNDSWTSLNPRELVRIWELKKGSGYTPSTTGFEEFWQNSLAVVPSANNHPLLIWGAYPINQNFPSADFYSISRKNGGLPWQEDFATTTLFCFF